MTSLLVPKHVHAQRRTTNSIMARASQAIDAKRELADEIAAPIPAGLPKAIWWRVHVIQIGVRERTTGGVLLSEQHTVDQSHLHGLGKVVSIGSAAYKAEAFKDCDPSEIPKVGSLVLFDPRAAKRYMTNGQIWFRLNDDHVDTVVNATEASGFEFLDGVKV